MTTGIDPDQLLGLLYEDLQPFAASLAGTLSVASDPWNFLQLLGESPQGLRIVLHWEGDENRMTEALAGRFLTNRFSVGLTAQKGLTITPQAQLFRDRAGGAPSLLRVLAQLRDRVCSYTFPAESTDQYPLYNGADPIALPDGTPLQGYRLRFSLTTAPTPILYRNQ